MIFITISHVDIDILDPGNVMEEDRSKVVAQIRSFSKITGKWAGLLPDNVPIRQVYTIIECSIFSLVK